MLILIKILLTLPVAYALMYPFLNSTEATGVLKEIEMLGPVGSVVLTTLFLALVFFYCRDLHRTLSLIRPTARVATPKSVWLMFLIPYNFVEDFFIVANVANSLKQEAKHNNALGSLKQFGMASGIGWCSAQIVSLLPNEIGSAAGLVALILWIIHWRFIRKVNAMLAGTP